MASERWQKVQTWINLINEVAKASTSDTRYGLCLCMQENAISGAQSVITPVQEDITAFLFTGFATKKKKKKRETLRITKGEGGKGCNNKLMWML